MLNSGKYNNISKSGNKKVQFFYESVDKAVDESIAKSLLSKFHNSIMFDEFSNSLYKIGVLCLWIFRKVFPNSYIFQNVFLAVSSCYWEMMKQKYQKLLNSRLVSFRSFLFVFSLLIATLEVMKATTIYILTHHPLSIFYKRPCVQIIFRKYYHAATGEFRTL